MNLKSNSSISKLLIASGNLGKVKEFRELLSPLPIKVISQPDDLNVDETGQSFSDNARLKAIAASRFTGELSLADDSGLSVDSLGGAPGIHSARYAKTDSDRINRLLAPELEKVRKYPNDRAHGINLYNKCVMYKMGGSFK